MDLGEPKSGVASKMEKVPRDILFNIFSRLPLKSVIQSSCVSKSWLDMIKDPSFVKLYISQSNPDPSLLILTHRVIGEKNIVSISPLKLKGLQLVADECAIDHIVSSFSWDLVGTSGGLLCFTSSGEEEVTIVCNPITREHLTLPKPAISLSPESSRARMLAFGFDPMAKKYKVVRVLYNKRPVLRRARVEFLPVHHPHLGLHDVPVPHVGFHAGPAEATTRAEVMVEVYTLGGTDSWREVQGFKHRPHDKPVCVNGVLYWLVDGPDIANRILSFDLGSEQFKLTPHRQFGIQISLAELGGSLAVVDLSSMDFIEISALQDPANNFWEMKYILPLSKPRWLDRQLPRLICVHELNNLLVVWLQDRLLTYDNKAFLTKNLKISGFPSWLDWEICCGFKGSLVPLGNSHSAGDEQSDVIHFLSDMEFHSLMVNGGAFGEQKENGRCGSIVASFQKNGLLI